MNDMPLEVQMHAERLYDEAGYEAVPTIIAKAIMVERERCLGRCEHITQLSTLYSNAIARAEKAEEALRKNEWRPIEEYTGHSVVLAKNKNGFIASAFKDVCGTWHMTNNGRGATKLRPMPVCFIPLSIERAAQAPCKSEWQPIETAPKDGTTILLFCPQGNGNPGSTYRVTAGDWYEDYGGVTEHRDLDGRWIGQDESEGFIGWLSWDGGFSDETMMPTHWQQLPPPPPVRETP